MKELSEVFEDEVGDFVFRYWAEDNDPTGELHAAGAILAEIPLPGDSRLGAGSSPSQYRGIAYSKPGTYEAIEAIRESLMSKGWILRPIHVFNKLR